MVGGIDRIVGGVPAADLAVVRRPVVGVDFGPYHAKCWSSRLPVLGISVPVYGGEACSAGGSKPR